MILPISPQDLREDSLRDVIYPDVAQSYYWSKDWDPDFYVALARAGFISISHHDPRPTPSILRAPRGRGHRAPNRRRL